MTKKEKSAAKLVWDTLSSVKLAIILLILLATISIIGTVLAQGDSASDNQQMFENMLASMLDTFGVIDKTDPVNMEANRGRLQLAASRLLRFSEQMGFTDLYHSLYFNFLLFLFALNLTVCSVRRWPNTWKLIAKPRMELSEAAYRGSPFRHTFKTGMSRDETGEALQPVLKKAGYSPRSASSEEAGFLFGQKGVASRLGVYATHLSILVILLGAVIGAINGFKGYMQIVEGTTVNSGILRGGAGGKLTFPFSIRCDDFELEYYENSSRPKDYSSELTVIKDGQEVMSKRIEVNHPLVYEGIYFYQSSYGETGRGMRATLQVVDSATGTAAERKVGAAAEEFAEHGLSIRAAQVLPDFARDADGKVYNRSTQANNPAALLNITFADGTTRELWVLARHPDKYIAPDFNTLITDLPVKIQLVDVGGIQYTGLQVAYDPGVWVIWLGCTIMVIGLYLAFFVSHRRIWVRIAESDGKTVVMVSGRANKNRHSFGEDFEKLGEKLAAAAGGK